MSSIILRADADRRIGRVLRAALLVTACLAIVRTSALADGPLKYPKAKKVDVVDKFHGVDVPDPYRWLEATPEESPDVKEWIDAENRLTSGYLAQIPERAKLIVRLSKIWDFERFNPPAKRGGRYFFEKNDGLQNQNVLYWTDNIASAPKVLLDPNPMAEDGTVAMKGWAPSKDGKLLAYGLGSKGSDWQEWRVRDVETGKDRDDLVKWIKFSGASWTHDGKGFFYSRYDEPKKGDELTGTLKFQKVYYHKLGTPQSADKLIYDRPDQPDWNLYAQVTNDGKYLLINITKGTERKNLVFYKDLEKEDSPVVGLVQIYDAIYDYVENDGELFYFRTDFLASQGRVVGIHLDKPARGNWFESIPQVTATLRGVSSVGGMFIAEYLNDAHSKVAVFSRDEAGIGHLERTIDLPGIGSVDGFYGEKDDPETFYSFESFTEAKTIYRYDTASGQSSVFRRPTLALTPSQYETKQVFFKSRDGKDIPMFITHEKGVALDGKAPTYLYGYGGFDIAITPWFSVPHMVWLDMGGVLAVANIRGGGEYGTDWHEAGMKLKKQTVFNDFIAAAEWLIENKYTSPQKLAIAGGSNGGLLVGACMTQRPELFGAALPAVGVLDMLRFNKFTIGKAWESDYGSPDNAEEFKALFAYSPYHNIKPGTSYPSTLITTADHDDRVVPAHSFKFAARLQESQSGPDPVLIRIETSAGHGAGKPTRKQIEEAADKLGFLIKELDMKVQGS